MGATPFEVSSGAALRLAPIRCASSSKQYLEYPLCLDVVSAWSQAVFNHVLIGDAEFAL